MNRPAVFFDRDNTLIISDGYLSDPAQVRLVPGAADAVARSRRLGYATVVFSNQSGVARGMFTEEDVAAVNRRLDQLLQEQDPAASIDRHEFCPFHPEGTVSQYRQDSDLRKPKPGMIHSAAEKLGLDLAQSWVIGDAPRDIEAGKSAGCRAILFRDPSLPASPAADAAAKVPPDHVVASLTEALDVIEQTTRGTAPPPKAEAPAVVAASAPTIDLSAIQSTADQILQEIRRRNQRETEFSVSRLFAGIVQVVALAVLFLAYLNYEHPQTLQSILLLATALQTLTIALLIMGKHK